MKQLSLRSVAIRQYASRTHIPLTERHRAAANRGRRTSLVALLFARTVLDETGGTRDIP